MISKRVWELLRSFHLLNTSVALAGNVVHDHCNCTLLWYMTQYQENQPSNPNDLCHTETEMQFRHAGCLCCSCLTFKHRDVSIADCSKKRNPGRAGQNLAVFCRQLDQAVLYKQQCLMLCLSVQDNCSRTPLTNTTAGNRQIKQRCKGFEQIAGHVCKQAPR